MVWYFIGVYIINRTLHGRLEIRNFSSHVEKIFHSSTALTREIFFNTQRQISHLGTCICHVAWSPIVRIIRHNDWHFRGGAPVHRTLTNKKLFKIIPQILISFLDVYFLERDWWKFWHLTILYFSNAMQFRSPL